jgi:predicted nucleotidyltransferase
VSEPRFDPIGALRTLTEHGVWFVLIGGYAAALRGSPMLTGDIDVCYARDNENLRALADALEELGAAIRGVPSDVPFRLDAATLRAGDHFTFLTKAGPVDCLGTPAGTDGFADLNASATEEDLDGLTVRVASVDDLIRMKLAAGRAQDLIAVEWLSAIRDELDQFE